ncbi:MAG: tryptophan-rich sensory protein [Alistipes sp.]|nr:tryptophan-rich sensory protein [Alistipes sp.]
MRTFLFYLIPVLVCYAVGILGWYVQSDALLEWYPTIIKSPLTPPAFVFPIAWSIIYTLMGISLGSMLVRGDMSMLKLWIFQLLLNFLWSVLFFTLRGPLLGFICILVLDVVVFTYIVQTIGRRPVAGWLFVPYFIWLLFATYLNGYTYSHYNKTVKTTTTMNATTTPLTLPALNYETGAFAPVLSKESFDFHYGKHFKSYIDNTNRLIIGTPYADMGLEDIVKDADGALLNNAAQVLNHRIYFEGLTPTPKSIPSELKQRIIKDFGSTEMFLRQFTEAATSLFGSGWVWLTEDKNGKLHIISTKDADNPVRHGFNPLMCIDVWEHAYYIDYRNRRADFTKAYMNLVDWDKAQARSNF